VTLSTLNDFSISSIVGLISLLIIKDSNCFWQV
jgi:hypothetical protein